MSDVRGLKECFQEEGRDVIPKDGKENPCSNLGVSKSEHGFNLSEYITIKYFIKCRSEEPVDVLFLHRKLIQFGRRRQLVSH